MINLREATLKDFTDFELHQNNLDELQASVGVGWEPCIPILWEISTDKTIVLVDDKPICLLGVVDNEELWLFFHKDVEKIPLSFFKESKKFIAKHKNLRGAIYHKNTFALEWAKFGGFIIDDAEKYGVNNELFHKFHR